MSSGRAASVIGAILCAPALVTVFSLSARESLGNIVGPNEIVKVSILRTIAVERMQSRFRFVFIAALTGDVP